MPNSTVAINYGDALRVVFIACRKSAGLSQASLGSQNFECGACDVSIERLASWARELKTSPSTLMRRAEALMGWGK